LKLALELEQKLWALEFAHLSEDLTEHGSDLKLALELEQQLWALEFAHLSEDSKEDLKELGSDRELAGMLDWAL
jgi:hypothetical protein